MLTAMLSLLWNRGAIVGAIMLPASDFLGAIDPGVLMIKGAFDTFAMIMILLAVAMLASLGRIAELATAVFRKPFAILFTLWAYGLAAPILRGDSSAVLAINASKEFMMIMAYPAIFLFIRSGRDVSVAWGALAVLGVYYCVLEILAQIGGTSFMRILSYYYYPDDFGLWKLYVQYWPVILIFLLSSVFEYVMRGRLSWVSTLLGGVGLLLTFYRSYLLATVLAIPASLLWARVRFGRMLVAGTAIVGGLMLAFTAVSIASGYHGSSAAAVGDDLVLSGIRELRDGSGGSLAGRNAHASELLQLAGAHPLVGYGFVKQEAKLIQKLDLETFAGGMLGFVDKGNADVMVKFGYLGGGALYGAFIWIAVIAIKTARKDTQSVNAVHLLTIATLALIFLLVQPVHAPCTYGFALLPFAIALGIVDREQQLLAV